MDEALLIPMGQVMGEWRFRHERGKVPSVLAREIVKTTTSTLILVLIMKCAFFHEVQENRLAVHLSEFRS
jgi:hypothetical protein